MNNLIIIAVLACILIFGAAAYEIYNQLVRKEKDFNDHIERLNNYCMQLKQKYEELSKLSLELKSIKEELKKRQVKKENDIT